MIDLSVFHIFMNFFNFELKIARLLTLAVTQPPFCFCYNNNIDYEGLWYRELNNNTVPWLINFRTDAHITEAKTFYIHGLIRFMSGPLSLLTSIY